MKDDNLVKQDIGVWVNVEDGIPANRQNCFVKIWTSLQGGYTYFGTRLFDGKEFICEDDSNKFNRDEVTQWLKPLSQVYVLTVEELDDLQNEWYGIGANAALH